MQRVSSANEEAIEAWNGVLFDRFLQYRDILVTGLGAHSDRALQEVPPRSGDRVLDIGCGFGDTTVRLAGIVGEKGSALGVDSGANFIADARNESATVPNVEFEVADVQTAEWAPG